MIDRDNRCILRAIVTTRWNTFNHCVIVRVQEKDQRLATAASNRTWRRITDAVKVRYPTVVGPKLHKIAKIDHKGVGYDRNRLPVPILKQDFKASRPILRFQNSQRAIVSVRAAA